MGRWLLKLADDEYVEWSSVVDAPVSYLMTRAEAVSGSTVVDRRIAERRVARCDRAVTSIVDGPGYATVEAAIAGNRAGPHETCLTPAELREQLAAEKIAATVAMHTENGR